MLDTAFTISKYLPLFFLKEVPREMKTKTTNNDFERDFNTKRDDILAPYNMINRGKSNKMGRH